MGFPDSSVGKESTCNAGDPGSIPGWGRSAGEGIGYPLQYSWASLVAHLVKNLPVICNAEDLGSVPGLGRFPWRRERLLQYSGLTNSMGCIVHGVAKSWIQLINFHFHFPPGKATHNAVAKEIGIGEVSMPVHGGGGEGDTQKAETRKGQGLKTIRCEVTSHTAFQNAFF